MTKLAGLSLLVLTFGVISIHGQRTPDFERMKQVSQLPAEVAQRASAIAFDGEKFWVALYADRGRMLTFDPKTEKWNTKQDSSLISAIGQLTGRSMSPAGIAFADGKMWFANISGNGYGWIDLSSHDKFMKYEKTIREDFANGQSFTDLTYDGVNIWASWKAGDYQLVDRTKTQLLLKIDPETGEIVSTYQILFGGLADGAHGLAWDGESLWYGFENNLRSLDRQGKQLARYSIKEVSRIAGIAWDGDSLWMIEFSGKLWKLPMADTSRKSSN